MLTTQHPNSSPDDMVRDGWRFIGEVDVPTRPKSAHSISLPLGRYKRTEPEPAFVLSIDPDPDDLKDAFVATLERLDDDDSYTLFYMFNNFGGPTYHVKVWKAWEKGRGR